MTYRGTAKNGKVELEPGAALPEGTLAQVEPVPSSSDSADDLAEEAVEIGLPDLAAQHGYW